MGNTNESVSNISGLDVKYLQVYQKLISMDFNEELAMKAAQKYPKNIEKAAEYVLKNEDKYTTTSTTNDGEIKEDEKYNKQTGEEPPLGEHKDYENIKEGWVLKKGPQTLAGWKQRYIQLNTKQQILYYTDESLKNQKGTVLLNELTIHHIKRSTKASDSKHSGFCVVTANRTYQFCVETTTNRDEWIQSIRHIIDANYDSHNMEKQSISYSSNATLASKYSYNDWNIIDEKDEKNIKHSNFCDERIIFEGYLKKKSLHLRILKRRWVILKGHCIFTYKKMYSDLTEPTETIDLLLCDDIIIKNNEFTLISCDYKKQSDRTFTGDSIENIYKWVDAINPLIIPPTTPIHIVFERIKRICDNISDEIYSKCIKDLKESWYYRAVDLVHINEQNNVYLWSKIPIILHDHLLKFINVWKQYDRFIQFEELLPKYEKFDELKKSNNITYILDVLKQENQLNSTIMDVDILQERLEELCLLNIDKFKIYCSKFEWDNINVPQYLKVIVLNKIHHQFEENENEQKHQELKVDMTDKEHVRDVFPGSDYNNVDPTATIEHICELLSNSLFVNKERIMKYIQPLIDYKYHRIYHLSQISDNVYGELMDNIPKCVRFELYSLMKKCKETMNAKTFPFYKCKDWIMETDKVFEILESDLNLMAGELSEDCNILMNNFYSNLWDWFFIPQSIWKQLPYYNTYEIVRIRIHDLMTQFLNKYNINNNKIILPELWFNEYNNELCLEQLLFGDLYNKDLSVNKLQFHFYGLNWNENTMNKVKLLYKHISKQENIFDANSINDMKEDILMSQPLGMIMDDDELEAQLEEMEAEELLDDNAAAQTSNSKPKTKMHRNLVQLQTVKDDYAKCYDEWSKFVTDNAIPEHILFKIVFYCSKGEIFDDDKWLNNYINKCNYPNISTQYNQKILIPTFAVENNSITDVTAKVIFRTKLHLECNVEISEESKESNWNDLVMIKMNQETYVCNNLKRFTTYKLRARYKYHSKFTQVISFKTKLPQPPTFIIDRIESISTTLRFTSTSKLQCEVETIDEEQKESKWNIVPASQLQTNYLDNNVKHLAFLKSNNSYRIRVRYKDELNIYSNYSEEKSLLTLPKPPTFSIQNILATQATFKVPNKSELMCYIEFSKEHALLNTNWIELGTTSSKEYLCTNLEPNNCYKIRTKYKNDTGFSQYSETMSFTTKPMAPIFSVGNVTATSTSVILSNWKYPLKCEVDIAESGYSIWVNWKKFSGKSCLCDNLKDNYRYQIRARYKNNTGYSEYSSIISLTTSPLPPVIAVKSITSDTAIIFVSKKSELQCEIEIRPHALYKNGEISIPNDETEYLCNGLQPNRLYKIKAKYKNKSISSVYSKTISFTTLPTAPCIGITNVTDGSATLTFPKLRNASKLICCVEIASKSKDYHSKTHWMSIGNFSNKKKYFCRNLRYNHMYEIRAKYQNNTGFSQYSKVLSFKTKLPPPPVFSVDDITSTTAIFKFFNSIRTDLTVQLQIVNCYEDNFKWKDLTAFSNAKTYTCVNLLRNTLYQIRAKYKGQNHGYTNALTFETMDWSDILTNKEGDKLKKLINNHTRHEYKKQWKLLYRGSEHGFTSKGFYDKCDMQPNTICIIKTTVNNVFGGFTSIVWDKSKCKKGFSQNDPNAFMYLIRNKGLKPAIFPVVDGGRGVIGYRKGYYLGFGPSNNSNASISLSDNCNKNNRSKAYIFHKRDYYTFCVPKQYQLCHGKKFTVKEVEVYQLYEKVRKHRIGNKKRWRNEWIDRWTNDDVIHWINSIPQKMINDELYCQILSFLTSEYKCTGEDLMDLECVEDVGNAFGITSNQILCNYLFEKIKKFTEMLKENEMMNNIDWENYNNNFGGYGNKVEPEEKFKCYLFSHEKHVTLNEKVTKKTKVSYIKKLFKQQTRVNANINDIHFYSKQKTMESNKTLEQCNIVDDRHLISVKFAAADGGYNAWGDSGFGHY